MARFEITGPDGKRYEITAPDGATDADVLAFVQQQARSAQAEQPDVSMLESLGRGALQGATFGFSDELYGAGKGAMSWLSGDGFIDNYEKERDAVRQANKQAQEANPGSYFAGEIGGGLALPMGAARTGAKAAQTALTKAPSLGARSLAAAKQGGMYGGAYGLGIGEGDLGDQALSTIGGAVGGATIGGALPGAVDAVSALARAPSHLVNMARNPDAVAVSKTAEALARDAGKSYASHLNSPVRNLAQSLDNAAARGDGTTMLADYAGENTKGLIRAAADMPNARAERFNQVLNRRQMLQPRTLERAIDDGVGSGEGGQLFKSIDDLVAARDKLAGPMFRSAFSVETPMTPQLERVLQRPTMLELQKQVNRRLADEDKPIGLMTRSEQLHRIKLELDEQIGMSKRMEKMGNRPTQGWDTRTLTILKKDLLNAIDNKAYKYALQKYAGPSALKAAAEDGLDEALSLPPERIASKLRDLTESEKQAWRSGAARALIDKVRTGDYFRDRTKPIFGTPDMQMRLKHIFPDSKSRGEFMRTVAAERRKTATRANVQGNSKTARYLTQAQEAGKKAQTVADVAGAATGNIGAVMKALERGYNYASGLTPDVAAGVLDLAMLKGGGSVRGVNSQAIQDAFAQAQARRALQDRISRGLLPAPAALSAEASSARQ